MSNGVIILTLAYAKAGFNETKRALCLKHKPLPVST